MILENLKFCLHVPSIRCTRLFMLSTFSDVLGIMEVTTKRIFLELLQRSMGNIFNLLEREMAYALTLSL